DAVALGSVAGKGDLGGFYTQEGSHGLPCRLEFGMTRFRHGLQLGNRSVKGIESAVGRRTQSTCIEINRLLAQRILPAHHSPKIVLGSVEGGRIPFGCRLAAPRENAYEPYGSSSDGLDEILALHIKSPNKVLRWHPAGR